MKPASKSEAAHANYASPNIHAAHTKLWQLLPLFLKSTLAQDVNRPFWAMKIAIFGLERTLK